MSCCLSIKIKPVSRDGAQTPAYPRPHQPGPQGAGDSLTTITAVRADRTSTTLAATDSNTSNGTEHPTAIPKIDGNNERALVADPRQAVTAYSEDANLRSLVAEVSDASPRFRDLWNSGAAGRHVTSRKVMHHRLAGELALDCDVLTVPGSDLKITLYTAAADSPDAERLEFLRVSAVHTITP
ncbi:hypothetical protein ABZ825_17000 [Streptomyces tauricus]|uniref:MmyB family transcriptional regulator n=1 Tax=Streptomyces tauricus TaxID=68274 RepID=UPI0033EC7DA0